jgi:hypothetical protein
MRLTVFMTALLAIAAMTAAADATTKKYPKTGGVNCAQKNQTCMNKCNAQSYDHFSVVAIKAHNECLNNCTIAYDLCLGAPGIQQQGGSQPGVLENP